MHIRQATLADAKVLAQLTGQLGYPLDAVAMGRRLQGITDTHSGIVLLAESADGRVVGYAHALAQYFTFAEPFVELAALVVDEAARSSGAGAALLAAVEDWSRASGLGWVYLRSATVRERAHQFYLRAGYREEKRQVVFVKSL